MKNFLTFILAITLLSSCTQEDPSRTIIEGTLVWDDGTPATSIRIMVSGMDDVYGSSKILSTATQDVLVGNEFKLELEAYERVNSYTINFIEIVEGGTLRIVGPATSQDCGGTRCNLVKPGHHYKWEIVLPRVP
ncbi:MAG: hypothetical protein COW03_06745 [Cytophagales bacterium CG12_big_fil_rev_8_21_14_0_65_40_12]|nr:MAG: hypothetical protein COW03_06745 [Cytophagales bacterium CG12_big_fil_rev_8_21_14_0_65_40_12]PIW04545.1 MAG: hypothetical protein COW40_09075 [Cytophagales bacterium CG17_big_fil_post_rev_8_21_14_2_50_40_13]